MAKTVESLQNLLIKELQDGKKACDIAEKTGISTSSLTRFKNGKRGLSGESLAALLEYFKCEIRFPPGGQSTIQRTGTYSPKEIVDETLAISVPVAGEAGAGEEVDFFFNLSDEFLISIPQSYYHEGMKVLHVSGDSMEPKIPHGSYVGVVPFDGKLKEGGIYLCYLHPFGYVIKHVFMGENGDITLVSENPSYGKRIISPDEYTNIIQGKIVWILQKTDF